MCVLISCETGGSSVPPWVVEDHFDEFDQGQPCFDQGQPCFDQGQQSLEKESRGGVSLSRWLGDRAARDTARRISERLECPITENPYSPLLLDVSRSPRHRQLFSSVTRHWSQASRSRLINEVHTPYRQSVRQQVSRLLVRFPYVVHLSIRTFASVNRGVRRRADIGLGYDPQHPFEADFCLDWIDELYDAFPMLRVRRNYPHRGTVDSITKAMRCHFAGMNYLGIDVQLNQAWAARPVAIRDQVLDAAAESLGTITRMYQSEAA